jgi:hypothetical protein
MSSNPNSGLWPRCEIELENGKITIMFGPKTLAMIERECGISVLEFAEKFQDMKTAPIFDLGMKIMLGAIKSSVPGMTEELLNERIRPDRFMPILNQISECWSQAVNLAAGAVAEKAENPPAVGEASPSST